MQGYQPQAVVAFWREAGPKKWFKKDPAFDTLFRESFFEDHMLAARQELSHWMDHAEGALALLVLLDQYPRNAFRDTGHMVATDPIARLHARQMVERGLDRQVEPTLRAFCYLPFGHSEDPADQRLSLQLAESLDADTFRFARLHAEIIDRFGRFPHRNRMLGRKSTPEEERFLADGGFSG